MKAQIWPTPRSNCDTTKSGPDDRGVRWVSMKQEMAKQTRPSRTTPRRFIRSRVGRKGIMQKAGMPDRKRMRPDCSAL